MLPESTLATLKGQQTQLETQLAVLSTEFGPSYPKVLEIKNERDQVNKAYREELQSWN